MKATEQYFPVVLFIHLYAQVQGGLSLVPKIKTTRSFLAYGEAGKRVLHFQADLSEVCLEYSSITNRGSDWTSIFSDLLTDLHSTVLQVDKLLRDKTLKTAFGSSEKP